MLRRRARIVHLDADWLELCLTSASCVGCAGQCGLLGRAAAPAHWRSRYRLPRSAACRLQLGDEVELLLPAHRFVPAVFAGLGLPLAGLLGGAMLAGLPGGDPSELLTVAGAVAGLAGGLWLAVRLQPLRRVELQLLAPATTSDA